MLTRKLDSWHLRIAFLVMGLVAWLIFQGATGRIGGKQRGTVIVEFGAYPEEFAGLDVEVDGRVVGRLQTMGGQARTGFLVTEGYHELRVTGPEWHSVPRTIEVGRDRTARFMLDAGETATPDGLRHPTLVLQ
jgi:hypothetical protein